MAKKKQSTPEDYLLANTMKMSPDFFVRNEDRIEKSSKAVREAFGRYNGKVTKSKNPLEDIHEVMRLLNVNNVNADAFGDSSNKNFVEVDNMMGGSDDIVIGAFNALMQNRYHAIAEYRNIAEFIIEIKRVVRIMARSIVARNEINGSAISLKYRDGDGDVVKAAEDKLKDIAKELNLEQRVMPWTYEALVESVKPIALIPYKDIIEQVAKLKTQAVGDAARISYESFSEPIDNKKIDAGRISNEGYVSDSRNGGVSLDSFVDRLLQDSSVIRNFENGVNELSIRAYTRDYIKRNETNDVDYSSFESISFEGSGGENKNENFNSLRSTVRDVVETITNNITVTDDESRFVPFKNKVTKDIFATQAKKLSKNSKYIFEGGLYDKEMEEKRDKTEKVINKFKDVLVLPLQPEHVIPIVVNGEMIGFYIIEQQDAGLTSSLKKSSKFSFTEMVKGTGMMNDDSIGYTADFARTVMNAQSMIVQSGLLNPMINDNHHGIGSLNNAMTEVVFRSVEYRLKQKGVAQDKVFRDALMSLIRQGYILDKGIRFTYIPLENMIYYAPNLDSNGLPVSIMDGTLLMGYMYISSLVSSSLLNLMKSADKEKVVFDVGMSKQIGQTISNMRKNFETRQITAGTMFQNLTTVLRNTSTYSRVYVPSIQGTMLYDVEQMQRGGDYDIDENFLERLLNSIISHFPVPPSILNQLNDTEYSRSVAMSHSEFRSDIVERQSIYREELVLKLVRRYVTLCNSKDHYYEIDGTKFPLDVSKIDFVPQPPLMLALSTGSEEFNIVNDYVTNITDLMFGLATSMTVPDGS